MEINGKVVAVLEPRSGSGRNGDWKSQTIVIEYMSGQYPEKLALTNMKNADEFGRLAVGATGTFSINPRSREYNGKWYTEAICYNWRMDAAQPAPQPQVAQAAPAQPATAQAQPVAQPQVAAPAQAAQGQYDQDDLPF